MSVASTESRTRAVARRLAGATAAVLLVTAAAGCRSNLYDQPRYEPYEASPFFEDGTSARPLIAGTVSRSEEVENRVLVTGMQDGKFVETMPVEVTEELLRRGQNRFGIYCTPCHGQLGDGRGMIVQRGFPKPPSYHTLEIRQKPDGHYFDVITNGYGVMYSFAARVKPEDRWAIVAYIRALQLSQSVNVNDLPAEDRQKLEEVGS